LDEDRTITTFLRAARIGIFDLSWNVLCPGCGSVLDAKATLGAVRREVYECQICAAGHEPTLDELVEVTFTVNHRVRKIDAHTPEILPIWEYYRQILWSTAVDLPDPFNAAIENAILESVELPPGGKAILSLPLPTGTVIVFEPATHASQFLDVRGEPTSARQNLSVLFNPIRAPSGMAQLQPGPLRLMLENRADTRVLPAVWLTGAAVHDLLGKRKPFLTANRLLSAGHARAHCASAPSLHVMASRCGRVGAVAWKSGPSPEAPMADRITTIVQLVRPCAERFLTGLLGRNPRPIAPQARQ